MGSSWEYQTDRHDLHGQAFSDAKEIVCNGIGKEQGECTIHWATDEDDPQGHERAGMNIRSEEVEVDYFQWDSRDNDFDAIWKHSWTASEDGQVSIQLKDDVTCVVEEDRRRTSNKEPQTQLKCMHNSDAPLPQHLDRMRSKKYEQDRRREKRQEIRDKMGEGWDNDAPSA